MTAEKMAKLTEKTADALIEALKIAPLVNITWGGESDMLCGNPFVENPQILEPLLTLGREFGSDFLQVS